MGKKKGNFINPLRGSQYEVLKNINCEDLARKVNEIAVYLTEKEFESEHQPPMRECCGDYELSEKERNSDIKPEPKTNWEETAMGTILKEKITTMGVSAWKEHGKKYGYWEYFEKETKSQLLSDIEKRIKKALKHEQDWEDMYEDLLKFLDSLK